MHWVNINFLILFCSHHFLFEISAPLFLDICCPDCCQLRYFYPTRAVLLMLASLCNVHLGLLCNVLNTTFHFLLARVVLDEKYVLNRQK